ncbi:MAG: hypothetical protein HY724_02390 [Candidatus Rokubacteria bacterium]|nr:hypothetical protein [Candidatus Rokubacteria bacterium]
MSYPSHPIPLLGKNLRSIRIPKSERFCTGLIAAWCGLLLLWWPAAGSRWVEAGWLAVAIGGSVGLYAGVGAVLKSQEWSAFLALGRGLPPRGGD